MTHSSRALTLSVILALLAPAPALARDGGDGGGDGGGGGDRPQVRVAGNCGHGATSKLKLKGEDGMIEVEFEVDHNRAGTPWRIAIVREGRVVWRGRARTHGPSGSFSVSRMISDYSGADRVAARALGPRGLSCVAVATLPA
jgi:hypothetical protein